MARTERKVPMEFASPLEKTYYDALAGSITEYNGKVAEVNAGLGNREELADSIRDSDEFADVRNQIATLQEQLDAAVNERVEAKLANATDNTEALMAEVKELKSTITAGLTYYKKMFPETSAEFPKVERVKGARVGGSGSGGKRVRGYNLIVTYANGESEEYENFASAAKALGMDTSTLQEQFFNKAQVEKIKDAPDTVEWGLSWEETDEDGVTTPNSATFKAYRTGPSGPTKDETPAATEPESDEVEPDEEFDEYADDQF